MPEYRVAWLIDVTADDPVEAAQVAFNIQRDRTSTATHFIVHDHEKQWFVDLGETHAKAQASPH